METYNTYYYQQFQWTNTDSNDTIITENMMKYRRCLDYNNITEITNIETANNIIEITGTYKTADDGLYEEKTHKIKAKFIYENNQLVLDNIESINN